MRRFFYVTTLPAACLVVIIYFSLFASVENFRPTMYQARDAITFPRYTRDAPGPDINDENYAKWADQRVKDVAAVTTFKNNQTNFDFSGVCGQAGFKCVISYGLYGKTAMYTEGAIKNAKLTKEVFPGWTARFYIDYLTVPDEVVQRLLAEGAEVVDSKATGGIRGMFARFRVASDPGVQRYIVRDTDSRLNIREKAAIDEWIALQAPMHGMRDHPHHNVAILGGMWGGIRTAVPEMNDLIAAWSGQEGKGDDQTFLAERVYPKVYNDMLVHDSFSCDQHPNSVSFPTQRPPRMHCGQVFDENDKPNESHITYLFQNKNPYLCRRRLPWVHG